MKQTWLASCTSIAIFSSCFSVNATDTQTFNSIFTSWGSPSQLSTWSAGSGVTACNMQGVYCDFTGYVVSLSLSSAGPSGAFPSQLSSLFFLTNLVLNNMGITGTIPAQLSSLRLIKVLSAGNNQIQGTLPAELSTLNMAVNIQLQSNSIRGSIPYVWGGQRSLYTLQLSSNLLTGSIPSSLRSYMYLSLYVNGNTAMCGSYQGYGFQSGTNIGYSCSSASPSSVGMSLGIALACSVTVGFASYAIFYYIRRRWLMRRIGANAAMMSVGMNPQRQQPIMQMQQPMMQMQPGQMQQMQYQQQNGPYPQQQQQFGYYQPVGAPNQPPGGMIGLNAPPGVQSPPPPWMMGPQAPPREEMGYPVPSEPAHGVPT